MLPNQQRTVSQSPHGYLQGRIPSTTFHDADGSQDLPFSYSHLGHNATTHHGYPNPLNGSGTPSQHRLPPAPSPSIPPTMASPLGQWNGSGGQLNGQQWSHHGSKFQGAMSTSTSFPGTLNQYPLHQHGGSGMASHSHSTFGRPPQPSPSTPHMSVSSSTGSGTSRSSQPSPVQGNVPVLPLGNKGVAQRSISNSPRSHDHAHNQPPPLVRHSPTFQPGNSGFSTDHNQNSKQPPQLPKHAHPPKQSPQPPQSHPPQPEQHRLTHEQVKFSQPQIPPPIP